MYLHAFLTTLFLIPFANAALREMWWTVTTAPSPPTLPASTSSTASTGPPRPIIGINNTFTPPIIINSTDTLRLHVTNGMEAPTSVHHHGMFFRNLGWGDGAVGVTQCPIPPNASYTYELPVEDWDQWGTYWVHAHYKGQYTDGFRAPFIIRHTTILNSTSASNVTSSDSTDGEVIDAEAFAGQYDDEFIVILTDWYTAPYGELITQFLSEANPGGAEPIPDLPLIYFATKDGKYLNNGNPDSIPSFNADTTLPFTPGKTYRLRIINMSTFAMFFFWIDGHEMRVIEVDGTDTQPHTTDLLALTVAQRYSILVTARNDTGDAVRNWGIHAGMDTDMFDTIPDGLNPNATSSITYQPGAPMGDEVIINEYTDFNDTALVPFDLEPELPPPDHIVDLNVFFDTMDNGINRAMFNNVTYNSPLTPSLLTELTMGKDSANVAVYGPASFLLQFGEIVEIRVHNWDAGKHPFHLHGHKFQITHKSGDVTSNDTTINPPIVEGQANPIRRDTVQVPSLGNAFLRIKADNPGAWLFHCHIEWHLDAGLAVTFLEAPLEGQQQIKPPSYVTDQCSALGFPVSGNAAGHNSTTDFSGLTIGPFPQKLGWRPRGIGAMAGCVLAAVMGWVAVGWYELGGWGTDEEVEEEVRRELDEKAAKTNGRWWRNKAGAATH